MANLYKMIYSKIDIEIRNKTVLKKIKMNIERVKFVTTVRVVTEAKLFEAKR